MPKIFEMSCILLGFYSASNFFSCIIRMNTSQLLLFKEFLEFHEIRSILYRFTGLSKFHFDVHAFLLTFVYIKTFRCSCMKSFCNSNCVMSEAVTWTNLTSIENGLFKYTLSLFSA